MYHRRKSPGRLFYGWRDVGKTRMVAHRILAWGPFSQKYNVINSSLISIGDIISRRMEATDWR